MTRSTRANRRSALFALAALLAGTGCGRPGVAPPIGAHRDIPPHRGGTFRSASFVDVRNLDPAVAFDEAAKTFEQLLFEPLIDYDANNQIVGRIAERFETSPDGLRYDFHLHRGVRFHDGSELTANDVKRTIERTLAPSTPCPAPNFYAKIKGFDAYHNGKAPAPGAKPVFASELTGVVVDGPYDLHIDLVEPDATFLPAMTLPFMAPLCPSAGRTFTRDWQFHPCGAGAFKFDVWEPAQRIRLVRHDAYFEAGKPYLDAVEWFLLMPQLTQRFKFETGELDLVYELPRPDAIAYRADPRWAPYSQWEYVKATTGVFMNTRMAPFDNVEFRRAIAAAADWDQVAAMSSGNVIVLHQVVPHSIVEYDPPFEGQKHDVAAALAHMRAAGYPYDPATGKGGYPEPIRFIATAESAGATVGQLLEQQLEKIGVKIELKIVSWPTYLAETSKAGRTQMGIVGWSMDFPDPSDFFEPILSSEAIQEEETQNFAFFSDPEFDELLRLAHRELDPRKRNALYRRCESIIRDQAPWAVGFVGRGFEVIQPYVHGYTVDRAHTQMVRDVWLDEEEKERNRK